MNLQSEIDTWSSQLKLVLQRMKEVHTPDPFSSGELQNNELRKLAEELKDLKQDRDERKSYASKLYWLVLVWLVIILLIVFFQGVHYLPGTSFSFKLSDVVLITLITTTTANVAAFFLVVVRYLFRPK
jgi:uncharacterized coiled-coil protein SlyX